MQPKILYLKDKFLFYEVIKNYPREIISLISLLQIEDKQFQNYLKILKSHRFFYYFTKIEDLASDILLCYPKNKIKNTLYNATMDSVEKIKNNHADYLYLAKNFDYFNNQIKQAIDNKKYPQILAPKDEEVKQKEQFKNEIDLLLKPYIAIYNDYLSTGKYPFILIKNNCNSINSAEDFFKLGENFHITVASIVFSNKMGLFFNNEAKTKFLQDYQKAKKLFSIINEKNQIEKLVLKNIFKDCLITDISEIKVEDKSSLNHHGYMILTKKGFAKMNKSGYGFSTKKQPVQATIFSSLDEALAQTNNYFFKDVGFDVVQIDIQINQSIYSRVDGGNKELLAQAINEKIDIELKNALKAKELENIRLKEILKSYNVDFSEKTKITEIKKLKL